MKINELPKGILYLVALSGGADSIALALMMKEHGHTFLALHCNFHLRGEESDRDENFVQDFCSSHNIPLEICHFDTYNLAKKHGVSIEMEARELRYTWFSERVAHLKAEAICVAHHKDDQAETLLLNLIRGTGLNGLAAMYPDRIVNGLRIIRPLLDYTKEDILNYLSIKGQDYVTDRTNFEREATRNKIRLDIIPKLMEINPNVIDCLARTAHNVRMELDTESDESHYHKWLSPLGFSRRQILDIFDHRPSNASIINDNTGCIWYSSEYTLLLDRNKWVLRKNYKYNHKINHKIVCVELPGTTIITKSDFMNKNQAFIDADMVKGHLCLRLAKTGDRFQPYGMNNGTKLVNKYLTDLKINLLDKRSQLVVVDSASDKIIWVVDKVIDNFYKVTSNTKRIYRISVVEDTSM